MQDRRCVSNTSAVTKCRSSAICSIRCRGLQWALRTTQSKLQSAIIAAIEAPLAHRVLTSAPCQEKIVVDPALMDELPIPRFFEHERGPYITAGAIVAKDRRTGQTNLSIARLMPLGGNRAFVGIAPNHHLAVLARQAHARGETLDIAVCIGNHPAVLVASCLYLGLGDDELKVAGALLGEPLDVVRCVSSDLVGAGALRMRARRHPRCRRTH